MNFKFKSMKFIEVIILPLSIIAIIMIGLWFIKPTYKEIRNLSQEINTKQEILNEKQKLVFDIEKLVSQYEDIKGRVNKVFYALPTEAEIPNILVQLEALASENGIIFESVNFGEIQENKQNKITFKETALSPEEQNDLENLETVNNIKSIFVDVKLTGSYENFKKYLKGLENNIRIVDVVSVNFSSASKSKEKEEKISDIFSYLVKFKVYYQ